MVKGVYEENAGKEWKDCSSSNNHGGLALGKAYTPSINRLNSRLDSLRLCGFLFSTVDENPSKLDLQNALRRFC